MTLHGFQFMLFALAVFRLTHLLLYDSITLFIRKIFLTYEEETDESGEVETVIVIEDVGWKKWLGELFTCHWCMSIWSSILLLCSYFILPTIVSVIIIILAASAVASIIESAIIKWL
ncbi:DUF1360 domain-containing protein [Evansella cellulosilytica]|uniref:DUF1360 domain-containing protein n=1 Tax=Evansella cellulosilytica (strain ATCC 21833 / DSM 2522 / FERM P-1141 / JCM 9156 / N-4) TaxID=649639 RepID=E6TX49_EVAC2|nr:DUF1360 domain-containing protein [Evansella cellulosilytica]ADU31138.1 protein of unknown function DUF1360 [Evansella cellulosilytica DSM 2522]